MAYQFEHSVEVGVDRETAWRFWTNVENWVLDADIEWVTLDGPFKAGARGTTKTRGAVLGLIQQIILPGEQADMFEAKLAKGSNRESAREWRSSQTRLSDLLLNLTKLKEIHHGAY